MTTRTKPGNGESGEIWNKDGVLVDPELDAHYKEQAAVVLGEQDGKTLRQPSDLNMPFVSQQSEHQTADVTTSPTGSSDPNTRPTPIHTVSEETIAADKEILEKAQAISEVATGVVGSRNVQPINQPSPTPATGHSTTTSAAPKPPSDQPAPSEGESGKIDG